VRSGSRRDVRRFTVLAGIAATAALTGLPTITEASDSGPSAEAPGPAELPVSGTDVDTDGGVAAKPAGEPDEPRDEDSSAADVPDKSDSSEGEAERPDSSEDERPATPERPTSSGGEPDASEGETERPAASEDDGERPDPSQGDVERPDTPGAGPSGASQGGQDLPDLPADGAGLPTSATSSPSPSTPSPAPTSAERPVQDASTGGSVGAPGARPARPIARPAAPVEDTTTAPVGHSATAPVAPVGDSGPAAAPPTTAPTLSVPPAWPPVLEPAGLTGADPADEAEPTPIFHRLAVERGCPDLGCAPEPIALQAAEAAGVPVPAAQPPAVIGDRTERFVAARTPSDVADPPDDNAETGGVSADNLPQSGAGGAQTGTYPQAQADDGGETLPTTGPEVLALVAMSQILVVGGAALRVAARPKE
jgi:hypothetical protein